MFWVKKLNMSQHIYIIGIASTDIQLKYRLSLRCKYDHICVNYSWLIVSKIIVCAISMNRWTNHCYKKVSNFNRWYVQKFVLSFMLRTLFKIRCTISRSNIHKESYNPHHVVNLKYTEFLMWKFTRQFYQWCHHELTNNPFSKCFEQRRQDVI